MDNAEDNSTVIFTSSEYENLNLIINHSLNLQSNNSIIKSNLTEPVFKIINTNNVSIGNFIINSKGTSIHCENSNNIVIKDTTITSDNNAILFNGVSNGQIINNNLLNNKNSGLLIIRSNRISISNNTIENSVNDGIILQGSVTNTNITYNQLLHNGIYTNYAINLISQNPNDRQSNIFIAYNNISDNGNGINVNITTNKLNITENAIVRGAKGVNLDQGYYKSDTSLYIDYNAFVQGSDLCIDARGSKYEEVGGIVVGYNWFNRNSNNGFICPKVIAGILQSNIRQIGENTYQVYFTEDGKEINTLADFNLRIKIDGKIGYSSVTNGLATFTVPGEVGSESDVVLGADETIKLKVNQYTKPVTPNKNSNTQREIIGNGSGSSSGDYSQGSVSEANGNPNPTSASSSSSVASSASSTSPSDANSDGSSQVIKTLTYDEDSFRVIGIPGLLFLIIFAILVYYNEDIRKALKR